MSPDCTTKIIHPAWARDALGLPNHDPLSWAEMASLKRGSDRIAEWAMGRAPDPGFDLAFARRSLARYAPRDYDRPGVCDVREPMLEPDRLN